MKMDAGSTKNKGRRELGRLRERERWDSSRFTEKKGINLQK